MEIVIRKEEELNKIITKPSAGLKLPLNKGIAVAQFNLGIYYEYGRGVIQNYKEAYYWYLIAYRNGNKDAEQDVKRIENILTNQQKEEVQDRVNEWFKTHPKE